MTKPSATRRQFAQFASAAIATSQFPILGANDRVNVGIVGLGGRGNDHINYYGSLDQDCRIAAVCDVNQAARERATAKILKQKGYSPKEYEDMRKVFESKDIDAVSLPLPNHWHALATIWACQAGKDVYVEKPASHNIFEGHKMVEAARKYKRMVQVGSQSRTLPHKRQAIQLLSEGAVGNIYMVRGICFRRRFSIGHTPDEPVPAGIDWDKFLGPAQYKPYSKNKFAYNWHWFFDTGNGDIGNQGVHEMDIGVWGLGRGDWPTTVMSSGGKFRWVDDQETPNTLQTSYNFGDREMTFEVRNLPTPTEALAPLRPNYVGNIFMGDKGFMVLDQGGFQLYKSAAANVSGEAARGAGAGNKEKYEKSTVVTATGDDATPHMKNFLDAVRSRDYKSLHAEIEIGARSAAFCHLANISYRTGRMLKLDPKTGMIQGDNEARALMTRNYRKPYVVPDQV
ncbi:MAG TPA: gfo/Idh/MocA family oxidoreductase [Solibacterales bacterium]|nr:gfo/Idh/MocA family oxidoreductase [Bryobacterales bacterium]